MKEAFIQFTLIRLVNSNIVRRLLEFRSMICNVVEISGLVLFIP